MKRDKARIETDKQLKQMEKKLSSIYSEAQSDLTKKWNDYMAQSEKRIAPIQQAYDKARKSNEKDAINKAKERLENAKRSQTLQNEHYKAMVDSTTKRLAEVNQTAVAYINNQMPWVYSINYNQVNDLVKNTGIDFTLVNEDVIKRRVLDGDIQLPYKNLNKIKDVRWNTKQLNSSVLQGILQGESMDKIANRILPIVNNNEASAMRNARTMVTGAENQGRLDSYKQLEKEGLVLKKVWIATADDRTREAHLFMDGQEADVDEDFEDGDGNKLECPGDTSAPPETVYNCRCSMRTRFVGIKRDDGSISYFDDHRHEGLHQDQIFEERERRKMVQ